MRHRLALLICTTAVTVAVPAAVTVGVPAAVSAASAAGGHGRPPAQRALPSIAGEAFAGDVLRASPGHWKGARTITYRWERCNAATRRCKAVNRPHTHHPDAARKYKLTASDVGHRIRVTVHATNAWGATSATSRATALVRKASAAGGSQPGAGNGSTPTNGPNQGPTGGGSGGGGSGGGGGGGGGTGGPVYFSTVPSSENGTPPAGIPRSDATCAAEVTAEPENRPQNTTANHTVPPSPSAVNWGTALNYWTDFIDDRNHVTGNYTGTTDEILQWAACKWGIDENIARADAVVESSWVQSEVGDYCGTAGEGSYGILQVRNKFCDGSWVHGGWPYTQNDTALDADYWGARLRACYDGAFYNGGQWLYNGQTIAQVIAQHGQDYALWGCIGAWFSGQWYDSGAQNYIAKVQADYASKPWLKPGF